MDRRPRRVLALQVLAVGQRYQRVPQFQVGKGGSTETCDGVVDEVLYEWDPETDTVKEVLHVSDYIDWQALIPYFANTEESGFVLERGGGGVPSGYVQFYHTSSVSVSSDERLYILALRDINTVLAVNRVTLEQEWVVSSTLESSYPFDDDADKFYQPHNALFFPNTGGFDGDGVLALVDDGNERPGCDTGDISEMVPDLCASRALVLVLSPADGYAHKVFDYAFPDAWDEPAHEAADLFNYDGGSAALINGSGADATWLVAFTDTDKASFTDHSYVFELDSGGKRYAMMKLPKTHWPDKSESGSYRVNPYSTLAGERSTALSPGFGLPTAKGDDGVGGDDAPGGGSFADDGGTFGAIDDDGVGGGGDDGGGGGDGGTGGKGGHDAGATDDVMTGDDNASGADASGSGAAGAGGDSSGNGGGGGDDAPGASGTTDDGGRATTNGGAAGTDDGGAITDTTPSTDDDPGQAIAEGRGDGFQASW